MPRATAVFKPTFDGDGVIRSDDILLDPRYGKNAPHKGMPQGHLPVRSYLAVPVTSRSGEVVGGLFFGHSKPKQFTEAHEHLMTGIAAQAAIAIDNARLYRAAQAEILERSRAEEQLRELNETLESRVAEEVAARSRAEEALRQAQKMEAVGQLTGGIAHDFNNLLTVVTGNIDMAVRAIEANERPDPRARRALGNALKGAERAAALTQRLLAFSRRQPLSPKPLDPDRLVAGMSDLLNRSLGETVKLEIVSSPGLWRVEADPNQLEAAILNLAVNARDAMPRGGRLTIETANARLDDAYAAEHAEVAPGQYVVIAITDTGVGMSKETASRVFEPFFTTKEVGRGTGLGLSQVYGFTKQSGGHVKIYSEEGRGTSVKIYLPRLVSDAKDEDDQKAPGTGVEKSQHQETVLVVEDDDDVRAYSAECLRELGYRVIEAHDGPSALRLFDRGEQHIDLLFTDVVMPEMTGRELADRAREMRPDLKVLYTSGYTRNAIVHGGRLDEGVEMISKPFTYAALAERVADVLEKGRTGRILLVEEEATLRMFATEALTAAGYAVDEAETAAEALARVRAARGRYDAVVLDIRLQGQAGDTVAAELRALHADLPILLASSSETDDLVARFAGDRCVGVIAKPFNIAKLTQALQNLGARCRNSAG
jgi:signal transduction histidine kinase/CheY-like chemotaxis protein